MTERYTPEETPLSILAGLAQQFQALLDLHSGAVITVPRWWLTRWREDVQVLIATLRHDRGDSR